MRRFEEDSLDSDIEVTKERSHRRNGVTKANGGGRSIGRRAKHADSRDVRGRRYKPLPAPVRFVSPPFHIAAGRLRRPNRTAASLRALRVLRGSRNSVRLRSSVSPVRPFPPSAPSAPSAPTRFHRDEEKRR